VALAVLAWPPHVRGVERHVVDGLRVLALLVGVRVREDECVVDPLDDAFLAAQVARAPRVARGVDSLSSMRPFSSRPFSTVWSQCS
jgi:hypothetical protein